MTEPTLLNDEYANTEWTAMTTSVICTSPHLEVAVWIVFLNLPLKGAIK